MNQDHPTMPTITLQDCLHRDASDPLRPLRDHFHLPEGTIYLDGNSLGALPRATPVRVAQVVREEWGEGLIRSWNQAGWFELPRRVGDKIARLIGAGPGEVMACDGTSINLFKVLTVAMRIAQAQAPHRMRIVSERSNFPTDLYIAEGLCREHGWELVLTDAGGIEAALRDDVAILMLTHINYRTGAMHDMAALTAAAHARGILTVWDLCHSAGAVPVDLKAADADFVVGCGYKYLNGGPGAPAFVWVHPRHADRFWQPLSGWWGHAQPFAFTTDYRPASGIGRYQSGTQPVISLAALECGVDSVLAAEAQGGVAALRAKSLALTDLFIALVEQRCAPHGLRLLTPRAHEHRGSQVSWAAPRQDGYAVMQALIARGVVGDFRAGDGGHEPDILRFGFAPLYIGHADVWHAVDHLAQVLDRGEWQRPEFRHRQPVT